MVSLPSVNVTSPITVPTASALPALMQGLADGYFVLPYTIQNYLADQITVPRFSTELPEFEATEKHVRERIERLFAIKGKRSVGQHPQGTRPHHVGIRRYGSHQGRSRKGTHPL